MAPSTVDPRIDALTRLLHDERAHRAHLTRRLHLEAAAHAVTTARLRALQNRGTATAVRAAIDDYLKAAA